MSADGPGPGARGLGDAAGDGWVTAAFAAGLVAFLLREQQIAGTVGAAFPLDDAWIHFQFARNLAEGHGFAYNPGVPVAGSTAPLWTLLLAGAFALLGSHPVWAKPIGVLAGLGAALLARRLALAFTGDRVAGRLAGVLTALAGPILWGALSGMEVTLAALLVTAALLATRRGPTWAAALFLGLACLARPEAVLLVPLCWLAGRPTIASGAAWIGVVGAVLAPWVAFNLATAGTPLPATAAAKIEGGLVGFLAGSREPLTRALLGRPWAFGVAWARWLWSVDALLPVLLVPGLYRLWRGGGRALALPAAVLVLHPLAMAWLAPFRGPGFQEGRYSIHLLPLAIACAVAATGPSSPGRAPTAGPGAARWLAGLRPARAALAIAALVALWPAATRYGWAVQNIEAMQVELGRWVQGHTPPRARLALNDVGAIAFLSRREVVDVMGLVTPAVIPFRRDGEAGVLRYLSRACPDYLIIFPEWFHELSADREHFTPVHRVRLDHNTVAGADEMVVYETAWNRWKPGARPCPPDSSGKGG